MQAYEFYARPENGVIAIPEQYKNQITDNVLVIVLERKSSKLNREDAAAAGKKSDLLLPPSLDTRGWKFDREEANER